MNLIVLLPVPAGIFKRIARLLLCLLAFAVKAGAQELPQLDTMVLGNGLRICLLPCGASPVLQLRLVINGGKRDETACQVGYSEIIRQLLESALNNPQASAPGSRGRVSCEIRKGQTLLKRNCSVSDLNKEMELWSTVLSRLSFKKEPMDRIVSVIGDRYLPEHISAEQLSGAFRDLLVYGPEHSLGRTYCQYQLQKVTPGQLRLFYTGCYTPDRSCLLVCGNFNAEEVKKTIAKHFMKWRLVHDVDDREKETPAAGITKKEIAFVSKPDARQYALKWVLPAPPSRANDLAAFLAACDLFNRFLAERVRAEQGLAAGSLNFDAVAYTSDWMELNAIAGQDKLPAAIRLVDTVLKAFNSLALTPAALEDAVQRLQSRFLKNTTPGRVLSFYDPTLYDFNSRRDHLHHLSRLRAGDVEAMIRRYFKPGVYKLIVVGKEQGSLTLLASLGHVSRYNTSDFETCNEACKEVVVLKCHCDVCWRNGQCNVWRFDPNDKRAIKRAKAKAKASMK